MGSASRVVFVGIEREPSLLYEECLVPDVGEGQILAKIRCATICGSDLHTIEGKRKEPTPSVLGHEAVAEVIECKRDGSNLQPGDRITFCVVNSCGDCDRCRQQLPQKCLLATKYGHQQHRGSGASSFTGCYASHIVLMTGTGVCKLPDNITDRVAAPLNCAMATLVNALSSIPSGVGNRVALVQGAGLLGIYSCVLLTEKGFSKVYITDPNRDRLVVATNFGGIPLNTELPNAEKGPAENSVDVVLEVCGDPRVVEQGLHSLRPGGSYLFVGLVHPQSQLKITGEQLIRKCLTLKGIHNYAPCHLQEAVMILTQTVDRYPYDVLFSPDYPLKDLKRAVQEARSQRYLRVVVVP